MLTCSISSFHRLSATESPSSSTPFASHTRDCPRNVFTLRASPFSVIVRSRTSNFCSAFRSFTFMEGTALTRDLHRTHPEARRHPHRRADDPFCRCRPEGQTVRLQTDGPLRDAYEGARCAGNYDSHLPCREQRGCARF